MYVSIDGGYNVFVKQFVFGQVNMNADPNTVAQCKCKYLNKFTRQISAYMYFLLSELDLNELQTIYENVLKTNFLNFQKIVCRKKKRLFLLGVPWLKNGFETSFCN